MPAIASYSPCEIVLTGKLVKRVFPGPPNFASVARGDKAEHVIVLKLDRAIDVKDAQFPDRDQLAVREMQVGPRSAGDEKEERALDRLIAAAVGHEVVVKAQLREAQTGHHHTRVLADVAQLKRKGAPEFPVVAHESAEEKAQAEAEYLAERERQLREAKIVDVGADGSYGEYTRFVGTLVERRMPPHSPYDWWIKEGEKICWILQLERPVVLKDKSQTLSDEPKIARELDVRFVFDDPLAQRDLRALGVNARDAWDPACRNLFGKRYVITGRLFPNSRYSNFYAEAYVAVDFIRPAE
jgi:hypothetical protein